MKNILKWRLGKLPTSEEVLELVKASLITKEEAREILFNLETEEERDKKSLESEIKFLRDLVEKLSDNKMSRIVEVVKQFQPIYNTVPWYQPYYTWCSSGSTDGSGSLYASNQSNANFVGACDTGSTVTSATSLLGQAGQSFSEIQTF